MDRRLTEFPEEKQIPYYIKFEFRKVFSANHVILSLLYSIQEALDGGQIA